MEKSIFIYWEKNFLNAPNFIKKCLLSWKLENPTWKIIELNEHNLKDYINIETEIPNCSSTEYINIMGVFLLEQYGGCWCNATTFCNQSLDNWLNEYVSSGFFAFNNIEKGKLLSNCFIVKKIIILFRIKKNNQLLQI